jgi:CBS domain containing-hemolysin-like protein
VETLLDILKDLGIVIALVLINAFFVVAEYAMVRARRARMEALAKHGSRRARLVLHGMDNINRYIAGVQVGITFAGLASGRFGEPALKSLFGPALSFVIRPEIFGDATEAVSTTLMLILITYLLVVLGELVPKAITLQHADRLALFLARPVQIIVTVFRPFIASMNALAGSILGSLRIPPPLKEQGAYSVEELGVLIFQSHKAGLLDDIEHQMLRRSVQFADLLATDVMIPRLDIVAFDVSTPKDELLQKVAQTTHARLPIYEGTVDNIIGIVLLLDLFKQACASEELFNLRAMVRPALFVPEAIGMEDLLEQFRQRRTQIAIVVDEHGGTSGLVTLEDVVEEVFGELQDTLEAEQPPIQQAPDGRFLVRGEVRLHEIQEHLGLSFEDAEADSIAGYVMQRLGRIARLRDSVETPQATIRVENMARHRITLVSLLPKKAVY